MNKKIIGYTCGAFDMFHVGHLNILRNAKSMCDHLIVSVSTDELIKSKKQKDPVIPFDCRIDIVRSIKYVDTAIPQVDIDKYAAYEKLKFNTLFVGDDWYGTEGWKKYEEKFNQVNVDIAYFPYTDSTSTSEIRKKIYG
jgi:glycerol-3-phosphate cytidylyltransferase